MSRIVIALGGNALGKTPDEQKKLVEKAADVIVSIAKDNEVIVTHGNGPQVGMISNAFEYASKDDVAPFMPFAECGAMSQGYIGYHLQNAINKKLKENNIEKKCATIITQVEVDENDEAFTDPTKPVGMFYTKQEAKKLASSNGYKYVEDSGRGYRRVVPSPKPERILEQEIVSNLADDGNIVITVGGGGIPGVKDGLGYKGVDAVIDKDFASSKLASNIKADILLILTAVDKVYINYNMPNQKAIDTIDTFKLQKYVDKGQFAKGSMLPKINACMNFLNENPKGTAIIASLDEGLEAINGDKGTKIIYRRKKMAKKKKKKFTLSSFTIIMLIIVAIAIVSYLLPLAQFDGENIVNGSGVVRAKLSDFLLAPINGFKNAADVGIFILILGGFLNVVAKTGALETGIKVLVNKLKGKELVLIPILMFIFSIGGTTYGMMEETVAFYGLLSFTMVAAGMDTIVASATVLLGAGVGVLGSTINPFAVGAAVSALPEGISVNQGTIILLGCILWLVSYIIAVAFVLNYAAKVKAEKGSTFLSLQEQKQMEKHYAKDDYLNPDVKLTTRQKVILVIFGLTFVVMIAGFIPWVDFGVISADVADAGTHFTAFLTGNCFGYWWFEDAAVLFFVMSIVIGIIGKLGEKEFVDSFIDGASDILSVILIIAVARGASVLMQVTYLDNYIIYNAAEALKNMPAVIYAPMNFILHIFLSILVPSSSGIATLSTPIMGALTHQLGFSVETNVMILVAANGLVNLITPTCGAIMGGLALARVEYSTWFKWAFKIVTCIGLAAMVILTIAMCVL